MKINHCGQYKGQTLIAGGKLTNLGNISCYIVRYYPLELTCHTVTIPRLVCESAPNVIY